MVFNTRAIWILALFLIVFIKDCEFQILQFGPCSNVTTVNFFDVEKFQGKWYEIEGIPTWFQENGHCAFKTFEYCNRKFVIQHAFVKTNIQFILNVNSTYAPGDNAVFNIIGNNIDPIGIPIMVTDTDYDTYAVIYGCQYHVPTDLKYITTSILARNTTLSEEKLNEARTNVHSLPHIGTAYLQGVDHSETNCRHYWTAHVHAVYTED